MKKARSRVKRRLGTKIAISSEMLKGRHVCGRDEDKDHGSGLHALGIAMIQHKIFFLFYVILILCVFLLRSQALVFFQSPNGASDGIRCWDIP